MSLANLKATTEYQEAIQATEGQASSTEVLHKHKQNYQLKKIKSAATDKWPEIGINLKYQEKGKNQINLRLCNEESSESLRKSGLQHIHLGIFMIRLHALRQRSAGTNTLVVLRDTRWEDSRQIIATIEVDLSAGTQLVYTFPDMILGVNDFHNHVEVAIHTHGMENVVDHLTTTSITTIPGETRSIEELEGMSWHLKLPEQLQY
ncbi:hypothetical protein Tco_0075339, partial [Tanacetum coccineum]